MWAGEWSMGLIDISFIGVFVLRGVDFNSGGVGDYLLE
jgi:hypothetical protein